MSKVLRIASLSIGATLLFGLAGCSSSLSDRQVAPQPEAISQESTAPADTVPTEEATSTATPVSAEDLALASSETAPLTAVSGRYIVVEGYKYFDTLTVLEFESGERAYFATSGGQPFGSIDSGIAIAADQASRDLTGFGQSVPSDGPAGLDAAKMLSDHKAELE